MEKKTIIERRKATILHPMKSWLLVEGGGGMYSLLLVHLSLCPVILFLEKVFTPKNG
jgi:hypothetical protein